MDYIYDGTGVFLQNVHVCFVEILKALPVISNAIAIGIMIFQNFKILIGNRPAPGAFREIAFAVEQV